MENWEKTYDSWKTTPPEYDEPTSQCKCNNCGEELFEGDEYYELDGEVLCRYCAEEWLDYHKKWVTTSMVEGAN